jgi:hypothetical protein
MTDITEVTRFFTIRHNTSGGYRVEVDESDDDTSFPTVGDALVFGVSTYPGFKAYVHPEVKRKPDKSGEYDPNKTWERRQRQ